MAEVNTHMTDVQYLHEKKKKLYNVKDGLKYKQLF